MEHMEPQQDEQQPHFDDTQKGGVAPIISIIVIIILLALGGLYYFTQGINQIPTYDIGEVDESVMEMREQSSSDALADIEADVEATDLSEIDAVLEDLDAELDQI